MKKYIVVFCLLSLCDLYICGTSFPFFFLVGIGFADLPNPDMVLMNTLLIIIAIGTIVGIAITNLIVSSQYLKSYFTNKTQLITLSLCVSIITPFIIFCLVCLHYLQISNWDANDKKKQENYINTTFNKIPTIVKFSNASFSLFSVKSKENKEFSLKTVISIDILEKTTVSEIGMVYNFIGPEYLGDCSIGTIKDYFNMSAGSEIGDKELFYDKTIVMPGKYTIVITTDYQGISCNVPDFLINNTAQFTISRKVLDSKSNIGSYSVVEKVFDIHISQ